MLRSRWIAGLIALPLFGAAHAQDADAQRLRIGESELYPSLRIEYRSDDNVARVGENEISGDAVVLRPELLFLVDRRQIALRAQYLGAYSASSEPALEWADHRLEGILDAGFGVRRRLDARVFLAREHEAPGENLTRGLRNLSDTPVEFNTAGFDAAFTYGAERARGNVSAGLRLDTRSYTNVPAITDGLDVTEVEPFLRFGYRVGGDARVFAELSWFDASFEDEARDYSSPGVFGGMRFSATGRLSGEVRIGVRDTDYDAAEARDSAELVLFGGVDFSPSTITTWSLNLVRELDDTARLPEDDGDRDLIRSVARLGWARAWSARFSTTAFAAVDLRERSCPERGTTTTSAGLEGELSIRRWLRVGASYSIASRTAEDCDAAVVDGDLEFDRQLVGAHVRVTL